MMGAAEGDALDEALIEAAHLGAERVAAPTEELDDGLLRRYRSGFLTLEASAEVERALAASPRDRTRLAALAARSQREQERRRSRRRVLLGVSSGFALAGAAALFFALSGHAPSPPRYDLEVEGAGLLFDSAVTYRGDHALSPIELAPGEELVLRGVTRGPAAHRVRLFVERLGQPVAVDVDVDIGPRGDFELRTSGEALLGARSSATIVLELERAEGGEVASTRMHGRLVRP